HAAPVHTCRNGIERPAQDLHQRHPLKIRPACVRRRYEDIGVVQNIASPDLDDLDCDHAHRSLTLWLRAVLLIWLVGTLGELVGADTLAAQPSDKILDQPKNRKI